MAQYLIHQTCARYNKENPCSLYNVCRDVVCMFIPFITLTNGHQNEALGQKKIKKIKNSISNRLVYVSSVFDVCTRSYSGRKMAPPKTKVTHCRLTSDLLDAKYTLINDRLQSISLYFLR